MEDSILPDKDRELSLSAVKQPANRLAQWRWPDHLAGGAEQGDQDDNVLG